MNIGFLIAQAPALLVVVAPVLLAMIFFMSNSSREPEGGFDDNDVFAIAGLIAVFVLLFSLRWMDMAHESVTLVIYSSVFAFACYMLFCAFRKGARERKKLAEADKLAPQAGEED